MINQNKTLSYAILASIFLHGLALFIRFSPPSAFQIIPADPRLEVVLVNAKTKKAPDKAEALAQANLEGGGFASPKGKTVLSSPLPGSRTPATGEALASSEKKMRELQNEQKQLATQLKKEMKSKMPQSKGSRTTSESGKKDSINEKWQVISGRAATIEKEMSEQNARPKKVFVAPNTKEVAHAMYYKAMQRKIEQIGTLNFPQKNGKKLYGDLMLLIPVSPDGSLYEADGGPKVERSSGNAALDNAAIRIVRRAAPFGAFSPKMRDAFAGKIWVMVARFRFTRDDSLKTE